MPNLYGKKKGNYLKICCALMFIIYAMVMSRTRTKSETYFHLKKKKGKRRHVNHVTKFAIKEDLTGVCCPTVIFSHTRISFNIVDILHDVINNDIL